VNVIEALAATAHLADLDTPLATPDMLLEDLAATPGVDASTIRVRPIPRRGRHGLHVIQWTQDARNHSVEGHTLHVALRRAVRASGRLSASPATDPKG